MEKGKMLVLVGESGSGKSTVQKFLQGHGIKKVITYTSRPIRNGEVPDVDYHYVSDEEFLRLAENGEFAEYAVYNGWHYGTAMKDLGYKNTSVVLTPAGLRALNRMEVPNVSFYIRVDRRSRLIKLLERGDNIEEAYRRSLSDVGQYDAIEKEVNEIIDNTEYKTDPTRLSAMVLKRYQIRAHLL